MSESEILRFARCLYSRGDIVEWRAIKGKRVESGYCRAEELHTLADALTAHNLNGLNIYVGINPRKAVGVKGDENVATFRALFVDFDGLDESKDYDAQAMGRIEAAGLPTPTMRVFSGHGVHAYWRLRAPIPPAEWVEAQERLIATLGTDRVIKNPERIMRLPGFENVKAETPAPCFTIDEDRNRVHDIADVLEPCVARPQPASKPPAAPRQTGEMVAKARAMLFAAKWEACGEGERNSAAFRHAAQMLRDFNLSEDDAWGILTGWNGSNLPPLDEAELKSAFESAKKHAKGVAGSKLNEPLPSRQPTPLPATAAVADPASELGDLIEAQIDGRYVNLPWLGSWLTDLGQCLTPGTRTVLVGGTGASKSLAVLQALAQWLDLGVNVAVLELERGRDFHLARVLAQRAGIADLTKPAWVKQNPEKVRALFQEHREYLNRMGEAIHTVPRQFTIVQAAEWVEQRAAEGCKIIVLDPVTALMRGKESWADDEQFLARIEKAARTSGASLICVTHPKKGGTNMPDIDNLAGGAAWARFPDAVIWLESHDTKLSVVKTVCGTDEQMHNRTLHLLKTRSGEGEHLRLAYRFQTGKDDSDNGALTLRELGIVIKKKG